MYHRQSQMALQPIPAMRRYMLASSTTAAAVRRFARRQNHHGHRRHNRSVIPSTSDPAAAARPATAASPEAPRSPDSQTHTSSPSSPAHAAAGTCTRAQPHHRSKHRQVSDRQQAPATRSSALSATSRRSSRSAKFVTCPLIPISHRRHHKRIHRELKPPRKHRRHRERQRRHPAESRMRTSCRPPSPVRRRVLFSVGHSSATMPGRTQHQSPPIPSRSARSPPGSAVSINASDHRNRRNHQRRQTRSPASSPPTSPKYCSPVIISMPTSASRHELAPASPASALSPRSRRSPISTTVDTIDRASRHQRRSQPLPRHMDRRSRSIPRKNTGRQTPEATRLRAIDLAEGEAQSSVGVPPAYQLPSPMRRPASLAAATALLA